MFNICCLAKEFPVSEIELAKLNLDKEEYIRHLNSFENGVDVNIIKPDSMFIACKVKINLKDESVYIINNKSIRVVTFREIAGYIKHQELAKIRMSLPLTDLKNCMAIRLRSERVIPICFNNQAQMECFKQIIELNFGGRF